jgi:hypothetical protein
LGIKKHIPAGPEYGCNLLNLGRGNVLTCHAGAARVIARSEHFQGDLEQIDFGRDGYADGASLL